MADLKISELSALAGANLVAADELAIVDDSASETKKITVSDLIANGVTVISDSTIPGAKILFGAGDVSSAAIADSAVATAKIADDAVTAAKLADESTVDLVTTLPASGAFTGQLALDTDDNNLYLWDGSAWQNIVAPGSVNTVSGSTTGEINIVASTSGSTVTISATIDNTTSAAQFLAGPTGSGGTVGYRTIVGTDLPVATTSDKGGVVVNGNGLVMDGDTLEIDNTVTSSATHHVVTYDANGLITGGRVIASADLPIATNAAVGGVIAGTGLTVDVTGNLSIDNSVTPGTYTKVTVTSEGVVSAGDTLAAADIPDHSAAKLTSGTIGTSLIANDAITSDKMADQSTTKFGGAAGSDNVTIFPTGDFKGQFFYDETTQDLYIYTGSSFVPITVLSGNLVNAGAYNANTNQMSSVTSAGSSAGFSVGAALPAPAQTNLNHYVVVDTSGTGTGAAPAVALAPPDMLLSQGVGTEYSLIDVSNAIAGQTASNISLIATGNIVATDVQAGIQELDSEKLAKAGDTMTGALGIGTASSIVFEGSTADDYETTLTVTDPTADRSIVLPDVSGDIVTTGDTGTVTSTMILDGTIVNADINASAEIAVSKLADGAARQLLQTDAAGTGVEWASNIDIPGTLDVSSAATFDSTVTATGLITANGKVSFPAGTAAAPGLYSGSDSDTGIYAPGANQFGVTTAGTAALTIDASQQVGIGTTNPSHLLDVNKTDNTTYTGPNFVDNPVARLHNSSTTTNSFASLAFRTASADNALGFVYNGTTNQADFVITNDGGVNGNEIFRIDSSGNVGIGATAPSSRLHLYQTGSTQAGLVETNQSASVFNFKSTGQSAGQPQVGCAASDLILNTNGVERMRIDSSGNVGIGTSSSRAKTEIYDSSVNGVFVPTTLSTWRVLQVRNNIGSNTGTAAGIALGGNTTSDTETAGIVGISNNSTGGVCELALLYASGNASKEGLRLDSAGNVGIGTTSPSRPLNVSGSGNIYAAITSTDANNAGLLFGDSSDDDAGYLLYANTVDALLFGTAAGERMRIDSSGNVVINETTATAKLTVVEGAYSEQILRISGPNQTSEYLSFGVESGVSIIRAGGAGSSSNSLAFETSSSGTEGERMRIDSSGRLLVGTSSATATSTFKVQGNSGGSTGAPVVYLQRGSAPSGTQSLGSIYFADNSENQAAAIEGNRDSGTWTSGSSHPGRLVFSTTADGASSPTERMRLNRGGALLTICSNGEDGHYINSEASAGTSRSFIRGRYSATTIANGTTSFLVYTNGNVVNTNNSYGSLSDAKLKENIVDANSQWNDLKAIQVRNYNFIEGQTHTQIGVVAQEVETVSPGLVTESPDRDEDGNDLGTVTKSVNYSVLYMKAVKALQEAMERIETLEQRLTDAGL